MRCTAIRRCSPAAVVARADPKWGETPCVFIELKAGRAVTAEELVAHCRRPSGGLQGAAGGGFGELPKTSTGKIQKFELRERARSAQAIE